MGKSTLFNALLGKQRAITDNIPGLTRDILESEINRSPYYFILTDTPGLDIDNPDELEAKIINRAKEYLKTVDGIILMMEASGPTSVDQFYIEFFRKNAGNVPLFFVINKADNPNRIDEYLTEFYEAGVTDPIAVSAKGRSNLKLLLRELARRIPGIKQKEEDLPETDESDDTEISHDKKASTQEFPGQDKIKTGPGGERYMEIDLDGSYDDDESDDLEDDDLFDEEYEEPVNKPGDLKREQREERQKKKRKTGDDSTAMSDGIETATTIAIVGRPNAGKSSLLNSMVQKEVSVVSDIPGTTRDTVDTIITYYGKTIRIVDTAGLRRVARLKGETKDVEFYSLSRTKRAIQDSRVVVHVIDAEFGITDYDKKIASLVLEYRKPIVFVINKWDIIGEKNTHTHREFQDRMEFLFPHMKHFPRIFVSALTGQRVSKILEMALELEQKMGFRISTSKLNQLVDTWNDYLRKGGRSGVKILYATQADTEPPVFVFFVRNKDKFQHGHLGYFENRIRSEFSLTGIPVKILLRDPERDKK